MSNLRSDNSESFSILDKIAMIYVLSHFAYFILRHVIYRFIMKARCHLSLAGKHSQKNGHYIFGIDNRRHKLGRVPLLAYRKNENGFAKNTKVTYHDSTFVFFVTVRYPNLNACSSYLTHSYMFLKCLYPGIEKLQTSTVFRKSLFVCFSEVVKQIRLTVPEPPLEEVEIDDASEEQSVGLERFDLVTYQQSASQ